MLAAICVAFPASALASAPLIATDGAHGTGPTTATVEGNGDPEGQATTVHLAYAPAGEPWCTSHGTEGTPAETSPQALGSGNVMYSEILVGLTGLSPSSEYCAEMVADNASGTSHGGQVLFTTGAARPLIATDGAHATGARTASVEGDGDPEGQSTTLHVDYAPAGEAWCTSHGAEGTPAETVPQSLGSGHAMYSEILVALTGLSPSSEYCAEMVAHNASGTAYGGQRRFTTDAALPLIATDGARATGAGTAAVEGSGDPEGQATTVHVAYALAGEPWCTSHGTQGTPAETSPQALGSGDEMYSEILVDLAALSAGSEYCAEMVASNASGSAHGAQLRFATPSAPALIEGLRESKPDSGPPPQAQPAPERGPQSPTLSIVRARVLGGQLVLSLRTSAAGTVRISGEGLISASRSLAAGAHRVDVLIARTGLRAGRHRKKAKVSVHLRVGARTLAKTLTVRL